MILFYITRKSVTIAKVADSVMTIIKDYIHCLNNMHGDIAVFELVNFLRYLMVIIFNCYVIFDSL